jgi:2-oxoglutarate dehydrogenase E1 component
MTTETTFGSPSTLSLLFAESLYADYLRDPSSVSAEWRRYFDELGHEGSFAKTPKLGPDFRPASVFNPAQHHGNGAAKTNGHAAATNGHANGASAHAAALVGGVSDAAVRQDRVDALVRAYRVRGHMIAKIDPLGLPRPTQVELDPEFYELTGYDLDRKFSSRTIFGAQTLTLREILTRLRNTYCR